MDRAAVPVEQAGAGQRRARRAQGADLGAAPVPAAQPGEHVLVLVALRAEAAAERRRPAARPPWARSRAWLRRPGSRCRCWPRPAAVAARPAASGRARGRTARLAIRSGSIALVKAIIEKSGISRKRSGLGRDLAWAGAGWSLMAVLRARGPALARSRRCRACHRRLAWRQHAIGRAGQARRARPMSQ